MEIYLVGGAVRDELLGRPVVERDWVVVGSTPEALQALGYRQVGRDFPVFLHPQTGEEYALARTERKVAPGHAGFVCHAGPEVTLEEDLRRRDLTVNAMARDGAGALIDPFGGHRDLLGHVLRHVSEAFAEDPLRVFRAARFAAQLPAFRLAAETRTLMRHMAAADQLAELSAERVWQELHKALAAEAPVRFFEVLRDTSAMRPWLVELADAPLELPATLKTADQRFAGIAWGLAPAAVAALCARLKAPKRFARLGRQVAEQGRVLAAWRSHDPSAVLDAVGAVDALAPERDAESALEVVEACSGSDLRELRRVIDALIQVTAVRFQADGVEGRALGEAIRRARLDLLSQVLAQSGSS
jgi:tRNA nucleotidyltransferase (CCA-adding enzyme)